MKRTLTLLSFLATSLGCLTAIRAVPPPSVREQVRQRLAGTPLQLTVESGKAADDQLIIVIGENHASVKTQQQLAEVLLKLDPGEFVQALLIEGGSGPVDVVSFASQASAVGADIAYWKQQLAWGQIAGYEYVALSNPNLPIYGVEDMAARTRFALQLELPGQEQMARIRESDRRGLERASEVMACLERRLGAGAIAGLRNEYIAYCESSERKAAALKEYADQLQPLAKITAELTEYISDPGLQQMLQWQQERANKIAALKVAVDRVQSTGGDAAMTSERRVRLIEDKSTIEALGEKINFYARVNKERIERVGQLIHEKNRLEKALVEHATQMTQVGDNHSEYFIFANLAQELDGSGRTCSRSLDTFYAEEEERWRTGIPAASLRERDEAMVAHTLAYLREQHKKRVVLLVGSAHIPGVTVALKAAKVSYIGGKLNACDEPVAPWEVRAWTQRQRLHWLASTTQPADAANEKDRLKEKPNLGDARWKAGEIRLLKLLHEQELGPPLTVGQARLYAGALPGSSNSMLRIGPVPIDHAADVGEHILGRGPVPGKPGEFYELYDRQKAFSIVNDESHGDTAFVYHYQVQRGGDVSYEVYTPRGAQDLSSFLQGEPPVPRVVVFGEADEVTAAGTTSSPFWRSMRPAAGGGGAGVPPPPSRIAGAAAAGAENGSSSSRGYLPLTEEQGTTGGGKPPTDKSPGTASSENMNPRGEGTSGTGGRSKGPGGVGKRYWSAILPIRGERTQVLRTINPKRASAKLALLDKQDPQRIGRLTYLEEGNDLLDLPFTPERGDHAHTLIIVARNATDFRAQVAQAARAQKLRNKQIALIMCGDLFSETHEIREVLLQEGALMVWTPDRQISREGALRLRDRLIRMEQSLTVEERPKSIDMLINRALEDWHREAPADPDLPAFLQSGGWVLQLGPAAATTGFIAWRPLRAAHYQTS